jgi:hypothetical protein
MESSVVLPEPDGPDSAVIRPAAKVRSRSCSSVRVSS